MRGRFLPAFAIVLPIRLGALAPGAHALGEAPNPARWSGRTQRSLPTRRRRTRARLAKSRARPLVSVSVTTPAAKVHLLLPVRTVLVLRQRCLRRPRRALSLRHPPPQQLLPRRDPRERLVRVRRAPRDPVRARIKQRGAVVDEVQEGGGAWRERRRRRGVERWRRRRGVGRGRRGFARRRRQRCGQWCACAACEREARGAGLRLLARARRVLVCTVDGEVVHLVKVCNLFVCLGLRGLQHALTHESERVCFRERQLGCCAKSPQHKLSTTHPSPPRAWSTHADTPPLRSSSPTPTPPSRTSSRRPPSRAQRAARRSPPRGGTAPRARGAAHGSRAVGDRHSGAAGCRSWRCCARRRARRGRQRWSRDRGGTGRRVECATASRS
ncbi:hypothetical protein DMC30DRAFT_192770 [Rhodotorula diobovata]|uniref:Proteophosphoglycan ppg4 n=1 Tax=Rhodotorula diobovata TaxID=5288 RepID=A0A5C5G769_9BASI|nr:hypothetical protein DMC30DRAFT_192770 [Rhodotorula diobovata]